MAENQHTTPPPGDPQTGTTSAPRDEWTADRLTGFWAAMGGLYGSRWYQEHGEDIHSPACAVWRAELASMTPSEAAAGWRACKASGDSRPCTIPQFVRRVSEALKSQVQPPVHRVLPEPKAKRQERAAKATEYLEKMREIL